MDYAKIRDSFFAELQKAENGTTTSLPFIKNPLPKNPFTKDSTFQAIVIGGTHYESQVAELKPDGSIKLLSTAQKGRLPTLTTEEVFLRTVQKDLAPHVNFLSVNLAFPVLPVVRNGRLDGKLLNGGKNHAMDGLVGKLIGETIEQYVKKTENRTIRVAVANDTVCLVLSGMKNPGVSRETLCGMVIGSGFNISFFLDKNSIIDLESENFNRFDPTPTGKIIDKASSNPGKATYEKEVSGLYLYQHYNLLRKQFNFNSPDIQDSKALSELAASGKEKEAELAQSLLRRSASLVAAQIAGLYLFKKTPDHMTIIAEGSVFKKGWQYETMVNETLQTLGIDQGRVEFLRMKNSSLTGAISLASVCRI